MVLQLEIRCRAKEYEKGKEHDSFKDENCEKEIEWLKCFLKATITILDFTKVVNYNDDLPNGT